jgi:hypothetical protein
MIVPALKIAALSCLADGDPDGAVAFVEELAAERSDHLGSRGWILDDSTHVCRVAMAPGTLERLVDGYEPALTRDRNCVVAARAALAEMRDDVGVAARGYDDAARRWAAFPHVLQQGLALLGAGRCLVELDQPDDAVDRLRTARDLFAGLGSVPLVREADMLLRRSTALSG